MAESDEDSDESIPDVVALADPIKFKVKEKVHHNLHRCKTKIEEVHKKSRWIVPESSRYRNAWNLYQMVLV